MKIKFENLGPIKKGVLNLNTFSFQKMNLIIGPNNSGKTYLSYLIFTILKVLKNINIRTFPSFFKEIKSPEGNIFLKNENEDELFKIIKKSIETDIKKNLPTIFHTTSYSFSEFKIEVDLKEEKSRFRTSNDFIIGYSLEYGTFVEMSKNDSNINFKFIKADKRISIKELASFVKENNISFLFRRSLFLKKSEEEFFVTNIFNYFIKKFFSNFPKTMFFPAERSGVALFYKQLLENRSDILREIEAGNFFPQENISRYSEPINEYIKFLNSIEEEKLKESSIYNKSIKNYTEKILSGNIDIEEHTLIYKSEKNKLKLDMEMVSSTVKSLAGFFLYLKYMAKEGDIIFIDEPELNLHPSNQRELIQLFIMLTNLGLRFILSTHSPIITQEINNHLLFEVKKKKSNLDNIITKYHINEKYFGLRSSDVNILFLNNNEIENLEIISSEINTTTFNDVIGEIYDLHDDLLFSDECDEG